MPVIGILVLLVQFSFVYHVFKTGRPYWWMFVIMAFPVMGCLIYFFVEVFPSTRGSAKAERAINKTVNQIARSLQPEAEMKRRIADLELNPSVDNKIALARECMTSGMPAEALKIYKSCLAGPFAADPNIKFGVLGAAVEASEWRDALASADDLLAAHAGYREGEVLLARARALEALGEAGGAEGAYALAIEKFSGEEARWRYAAMLKAAGQPERARQQLEAILRNAERSPAFYRDAQAEWIKAAKRELAESAPPA